MPVGLGFGTRSRQPPLDVANSALSFLYMVLLGECVTVLLAMGSIPV
jgi:CRISP-associated protein Cas1